MPVLALSLVLSIAPAPVAFAQDGVQVDPDSPPAVEYALPLDDARGDNAPSAEAGAGDGAAGGVQDEGPTATFGSGITPKQAVRPGSSSGAGSKPRRQGDDGSSSASGSGGAAAPSTDARAGDVGGRATLYSVGGAAVILLAGGLVGLALRRRQPSA